MSMLPKVVRYGSLIGAAAGVVMIVVVHRTQAAQQIPAPVDPPVPPPAKPFVHAVAATGILEALSENVAIGVPAAGLVSEVLVKVGDEVKINQPLFRIDDSELQAGTLTTQAQLATSEAQVAVEKATLAKLELQLQRLETLSDPRAVSREDLDNRRSDVSVAKARIQAAEAQVATARAELQRLDILLKRLTVRAPREGSVIQVNVRAGEFAGTAPKNPAMIVGDLKRLQIRADVDEQNATRIRNGQKAIAYLKGNPNVTMPLEFVRIEPYVIPKVSLTGASTERVDTRVLQVIYSLERPRNAPLYVGQQVDVFIEAPEMHDAKP